jgi:hypothetical protein
MGPLTFEKKKALVVGLLFDCPFCKALDNCPAKEARKLPVSERIDIAKGMDENQLDQIIDHHRDCLRRREESL